MAMDEHFFGARATAIVNIVIFDATNHEHTVGVPIDLKYSFVFPLSSHAHHIDDNTGISSCLKPEDASQQQPELASTSNASEVVLQRHSPRRTGSDSLQCCSP